MSKIFEFVQLIGRLKSTQRTGWVRRGVKHPESIADHMYRMAALSFLVDSKSGLNKDKSVQIIHRLQNPSGEASGKTGICIKISLVHDMAECIVGDITPSDNVSKEDKHKMEREAMERIMRLVGDEVGQELFSLWLEYEDQSSAEAKFVKDLDRFEMIFQAYEYEQSDKKPGFLQEFFDSTEGVFTHPTVQSWVKDLNKKRKESLESKTSENKDET